MSDPYPISNQSRHNSITKQGGNLQRQALKIEHSGNIRGVRLNVGPNQTGYDHMYATDTEDGQPRQQVALTCANSGSGTNTIDTVSTVIPEDHHFLKDFLLIHLDIIQQQNEEILKKDNTIYQLQQENDLLKQQLQILKQHNSTSTPAPLTTLNHTGAVPAPAHNSPDHLEQNQHTAPGDYSPESIPPTEDVVAPDVGDDMTLAEPEAPLTADSIISSKVVLPTLTPAPVVAIVIEHHQQQEPVVVSAQQDCVEHTLVELVTGVVNCTAKESTEVVIIEDDSTDAEVQVQQLVQTKVVLPQKSDFLGAEEVERTAGCDTSTCEQSTAPSTTEEDTSITVTDHGHSPVWSTVTFVPSTIATARYSVVRSSVASDSSEPNAKNLRMSIRRKRLCSGSSQSNSENVATVESNETKGRDAFGVVRGKGRGKTKRKRLNGQILTFPQEYLTRVGEANIDVLRQQALAEEVIKAANLEVPHWRVKVYADSYHLEGTENLDDEVFLKRHARLENDERRRKRWDVQRIREQRIVEKLKQRQTKSHQLNSDQPHSKLSTNGGSVDGSRPDSLDGYDTPASLWPAPEYDLQYIEVTDQLPVGAFGAPLPSLVPSEFALPWLGSEEPQRESIETEVSISAATGIIVQSNNGRKSGGSRKSSRDSGGVSSKRRSRR